MTGHRRMGIAVSLLPLLVLIVTAVMTIAPMIARAQAGELSTRVSTLDSRVMNTEEKLSKLIGDVAETKATMKAISEQEASRSTFMGGIFFALLTIAAERLHFRVSRREKAREDER